MKITQRQTSPAVSVEETRTGEKTATVSVGVTVSFGASRDGKFRNFTLRAGLDVPADPSDLGVSFDEAWDRVEREVRRRVKSVTGLVSNDPMD